MAQWSSWWAGRAPERYRTRGASPQFATSLNCHSKRQLHLAPWVDQPHPRYGNKCFLFPRRRQLAVEAYRGFYAPQERCVTLSHRDVTKRGEHVGSCSGCCLPKWHVPPPTTNPGNTLAPPGMPRVISL